MIIMAELIDLEMFQPRSVKSAESLVHPFGLEHGAMAKARDAAGEE